MSALYECPVCLYPRLAHPFDEGMICPACGTECDCDDFATTPRHRRGIRLKLRHAWIDAGAGFWLVLDLPADWPEVRGAMLARIEAEESQ